MSSKLALVAFAFAALVLAPACDKKKVSCSGSLGGCHEGAENCGIQLSCDDGKPRELRCEPPDTKLPMKCKCIFAGEETKTVDVSSELGGLEDATGIAAHQCAWDIER